MHFINLVFVSLSLKEMHNQIGGLTVLFVIHVFIGCLFISTFLLIAVYKTHLGAFCTLTLSVVVAVLT